MSPELEELIRERFKELAGKPFGINPYMAYNRDNFVETTGKLFDVEKAYQRLNRNPHDIGALNDLIGIAAGHMTGKPEDNIALLSQNPHVAIDQGDVLLSKGYTNLAKFVENHRNQFLSELSAEQLYALFEDERFPYYKTNDREHERASKLREKILQMKAAQKQGISLDAVVQQEVKELIEAAPEEQRIFIARNQHLVIPYLTRAIIEELQGAYAGLFRDKEGNLDRNALINYLIANYNVAEDFIAGVPDKEQADYWNDNLKPQYVEIARQLYSSEKAAKERDENPEKEARKDRARELGLRA